MRQKIIILIFSLFTYNIFACDCGSAGEFLTVAPKSEFVALIKVTKYLTYERIYNKETPMSMEVEVINVYKGEEKRKTVKVWGDNGNLCRPYLSQFKEGQYYVIAFIRGSDGTIGHVHDEERTTDYAISFCGDYWLQVDMVKKTAFGSVINKQREIKLKEIKASISKK